MPPATPLPVPPPHDRLLTAAREWLRRSWGRHLASVDSIFGDDTAVSLAPRLVGLHGAPTGNPLVGQPLDRELFDAVRAWGVAVREEYPCQLRINATDGSHATLTVPPNMPGDATPEPDPPHYDGPDEPPEPAWRFGDRVVTLAGYPPFPCTGKKLTLLRLLVGSPRAMTTAEILEAVWEPRDAMTPQSVYTLVDQLKAHLRKHLNGAAAVTNTPVGYVLTYPSEPIC